MDPYDVEKTVFRAPISNFHYMVMLFGLKNPSAIYWRAMTSIFHDMLHVCLEDCENHIVMKSREASQHNNDLRKVFLRGRYCNLRRSPLKCAFIVSSAKFLGFTDLRK